MQRSGPGSSVVGCAAGYPSLADLLAEGSKHWSPNRTMKLWQRTDKIIHNILNNIKPETMPFWENLFLVCYQPALRPKQSSVLPIVDFGRAGPSPLSAFDKLDLIASSGVLWWICVPEFVFFEVARLQWLDTSIHLVKKFLSLLDILASAAGIFFNPLAEKYVNIILNNANTGYAEVGSQTSTRSASS